MSHMLYLAQQEHSAQGVLLNVVYHPINALQGRLIVFAVSTCPTLAR